MRKTDNIYELYVTCRYPQVKYNLLCKWLCGIWVPSGTYTLKNLRKKCKMKSKRKGPVSGRVQVPPSRAWLSSVSSASLSTLTWPLWLPTAALDSSRLSSWMQMTAAAQASASQLSKPRREGNLFKTFNFIYDCCRESICDPACVWQSEDSFWELVLSFQPQGPGTESRLSGWHGEGFPTLCHLRCTRKSFFRPLLP